MKKIRELNELENLQLKEDLYAGVLHRASQLSFVLSLAHLVYGFSTISIINMYDGSISTFDNVWPRILFNAVPIGLLGLFLKRVKNKVLGAYVWAVGYTAIFIGACMIHVWPIMYSGKYDIYLYFHAANMFIYSLGLVVIAPPTGVMVAYVSMFTVVFLAPVLYMISGNFVIASFVVNDFITATAGAGVAAYFGFSVRKKLSSMNIAIRGDITPFLGKKITSEIYRGNIDSMGDQVNRGLMMSIDIRGYTNFKQNEDPAVTAKYMKDYHLYITQIVGQHGGYIHKSNGDGHLISFGVIDEAPDLNDIPGLGKELDDANRRKMAHYIESADTVFCNLVKHILFLNEKYGIQSNVAIGGALGMGDVSVTIHGDMKYRSEVDIDGEVIFRVARLEAYSKVIIAAGVGGESCLIFSPELEGQLPSDNQIKMWSTEGNSAVRDFPHIKHVFWRSIRHSSRAKVAS